jgi:hypothetical protein
MSNITVSVVYKSAYSKCFLLQTEKEEVKLFLLANDSIYRKILRFHQKTIQTNKLSEVAGHNMNIQKSVANLYTNNKLSEKEIL